MIILICSKTNTGKSSHLQSRPYRLKMDYLRHLYSSSRPNDRGTYEQVSSSSSTDSSSASHSKPHRINIASRRRCIPVIIVVAASMLVVVSLSHSRSSYPSGESISHVDRVYNWVSTWAGDPSRNRELAEAPWIDYQRWDLPQPIYDNLVGAEMQLQRPSQKDRACKGWTSEQAISEIEIETAMESEDEQDEEWESRCWRDKPFKQLHKVMQSRPNLFSSVLELLFNIEIKSENVLTIVLFASGLMILIVTRLLSAHRYTRSQHPAWYIQHVPCLFEPTATLTPGPILNTFMIATPTFTTNWSARPTFTGF